MKKLIFILFIALTLSCTRQTDLSDSVYIYDSEYPDLPAYSEWGYNTFGANYDRSVFTFSPDKIPLKITLSENKLSFIFQGIDANYSNNNLALRFILTNSNVNIYQDLLVYNDTIIKLDSEAITVEMIYDGSAKIIDIIEGELHFKKCRKLFIDDIENEIIMSGYFNLKFIVNNIPSNMSEGRFDFGVNNGNFHNLND